MNFSSYQGFAIGCTQGWGKSFTAEVRDPSSWALFYSMDGWPSPEAAFLDAQKWADENSPQVQIDNFTRSGLGASWQYSDGANIVTVYNIPGSHEFGYAVNGMNFNACLPTPAAAAFQALSILNWQNNNQTDTL